jgi:hypothetical protein
MNRDHMIGFAPVASPTYAIDEGEQYPIAYANPYPLGVPLRVRQEREKYLNALMEIETPANPMRASLDALRPADKCGLILRGLLPLTGFTGHVTASAAMHNACLSPQMKDALAALKANEEYTFNCDLPDLTFYASSL